MREVLTGTYEFKIPKVFYLYCWKRNGWNWWFRFFGYGLTFSRNQLFSDRHFKRKRFFGWYIRPLKP